MSEILVVGDVMLDEFVIGSVNRVSPEAPIMIVDCDEVMYGPGGAANSASWISKNMGTCRVAFVAGDRLCEHLVLDLDRGALVLFLQGIQGLERKTRFLAAGQYLLRADTRGELSTEYARGELIKWIQNNQHDFAGILVSDYAKGVISRQVLEAIKAVARNESVPLVLDSKNFNHDIDQIDVMVPNMYEARSFTGVGEPALAAEVLGNRLLVGAIVTMGSKGAWVSDGAATKYLSAPKHESIDAIGAGDAVASSVVTSLVSGLGLFDAAEHAMIAGAISTTVLGTTESTRHREE